MGKKIQICLWIIVALVALLLLGGIVCNFVRAKNEKIIHPEVTFEIENLGTVKMELYQEYAPNTVANIVKLVEKGYYTDKVIYGKDDTVIYMGITSDGIEDVPKASFVNPDIKLDSEEDFSYSIPGEFSMNGFNQNTLCHEKGIVTLVRQNYGSSLLKESYNSGISKMGIIMNDTAASLNGAYAAFGKITEGMDLLENLFTTQEIVAPEVNEETGEIVETGVDEFANKLVIKSATVDTHGIDMGVPEMVENFDYEEYIYQMFNAQYGG